MSKGYLNSYLFNYIFIISVIGTILSYLFVDSKRGINIFQGLMLVGTISFMIFLIIQYVKLLKREISDISSSNSFWFNVLPIFFCFFGLNNEPFFNFKVFWYSKMFLGLLFIFQFYIYHKARVIRDCDKPTLG